MSLKNTEEGLKLVSLIRETFDNSLILFIVNAVIPFR